MEVEGSPIDPRFQCTSTLELATIEKYHSAARSEGCPGPFTPNSLLKRISRPNPNHPRPSCRTCPRHTLQLGTNTSPAGPHIAPPRSCAFSMQPEKIEGAQQGLGGKVLNSHFPISPTPPLSPCPLTPSFARNMGYSTRPFPRPRPSPQPAMVTSNPPLNFLPPASLEIAPLPPPAAL